MRVCNETDEKILLARDPFRPTASEEEQRETERLRHQRLMHALKEVLSTREGRMVLWQLLSETGLYRSSFSADLAVMSFNEGQRNVGLKLLDRIISVGPEAYKLMQEEANERRTN